MVAVQRTRIIALLVSVALVASPAALTPALAALAEEDSQLEPDCYPAEDGTDAYVCQLPEDCGDGTNLSCEPPDSCEFIDEGVIRCDSPQSNNTGTRDANDTSETTHEGPSVSDLLQPPADEQPPDPQGAVVDCYREKGTGTLVCEPTDRCETWPQSPSCQPTGVCELGTNGAYRCDPRPGRDVSPAQAAENRNSGQEPGSSRPSQQEDTDNQTDGEPACQPGPEDGTLVCEPPAECVGRIGETEYCTPPEPCKVRGDGTFLCELPDRASSRDAGSSYTDVGDGDLDNASLFGTVDAETRAQVRAEIAAALADAAENFSQQLDALREEYEAQVDDLRQEYREGKAQLRDTYDDCRAQIPSNVSTQEHEDRLHACLEEARQGLADVRAELIDRHDKLQEAFKQRAEQARQAACEDAEQAALNAIAEHGVLEANPGDLVPARALELCPAFTQFEEGGGSE